VYVLWSIMTTYNLLCCDRYFVVTLTVHLHFATEVHLFVSQVT